MKYQKNLLLLFIAFAILTFQHPVFAQQDVTSQLQVAKKLVYENPDESITIASQLLSKATITTEDKINVLLVIASAYSSKRNYEKSLEFALKAEACFPLIKDETKKINTLNNIGSKYQELKIYNKAIDYLNKSLELINRIPEKDSIPKFLAYNHATRGIIYREQLSCEVALQYFNKAIIEFEKMLHRPIMNSNISIMYYNKGNCLISLDQKEAAKDSFKTAIAFAEKNTAKSLIAFAQKGMAEVMTLEGKYAEAIATLEQASINSNKVGDLVLNSGLYEALSNNYLALNDLKNYELFQKKNSATIQQIKENEQKTINQSLSNLLKEKSTKINDLKKQYQLIELVLGILVFLIILFLLYLIFTSEKKLNSLETKLKGKTII